MLNFLKLNKARLIFLTTAFVISIVFTKYYFLCTHEYYPASQSDKIANFEAHKVFQKRFLIPVTADFLSWHTPFSFDQSLKFITVFCTFGIIYFCKNILNLFTNSNSNHYWSILLLIPVSWNYMFINSIYHAYDIPSLFFYCACLYLFLNKSFTLFYILYIAATLNRESTCFITISIAILILNFNSDFSLKKNFHINSQLVKHLLSQTLVWLILVFLFIYL